MYVKRLLVDVNALCVWNFFVGQPIDVGGHAVTSSDWQEYAEENNIDMSRHSHRHK